MDAHAIREVQFREKLRGYHPDDVDAFVARVAETVDQLQQRVAAAEAKLAEHEARSAESGGTEESLRRTLVLAQRTADLAVQEAREEAARLLAEAHAERDAVTAEVDEHRTRLRGELEAEVQDERTRLHAERAALAADVDALEQHLTRERERLRIYFTDQLRRVDDGEPGLADRPTMEGPAEAPAAATGDAPATAEGGAEDHDRDLAASGAAADAVPAPGDDGEPSGEHDAGSEEAADEDPFLAELRRAVTDERPLGPRDDDAPGDTSSAEPAEGDDGFDLFAQGGDEGGRFGSRLRRRR